MVIEEKNYSIEHIVTAHFTFALNTSICQHNVNQARSTVMCFWKQFLLQFILQHVDAFVSILQFYFYDTSIMLLLSILLNTSFFLQYYFYDSL